MLYPNRTIIHGDNLEVLRSIDSESIDLIYLDPPYNTGKVLKGNKKLPGVNFNDKWVNNNLHQDRLEKIKSVDNVLFNFIDLSSKLYDESICSYLSFICLRLFEIHKLLKDTGTICLHCDPRSSHYLKSCLDRIFESKNFINEVIWSYNWPKNSKKHFARKHDILFLYSKTKDYVFNIDSVRIPYSKKQFNSKYDNEPHLLGSIPTDVFEIPLLNRASNERNGYPTQKPVILLERIIKASSNEGNIVLDPFCGSGTTLNAAENLGRQWIGIDQSADAVKIASERMAEVCGMFGEVNTVKI